MPRSAGSEAVKHVSQNLIFTGLPNSVTSLETYDFSLSHHTKYYGFGGDVDTHEYNTYTSSQNRETTIGETEVADTTTINGETTTIDGRVVVVHYQMVMLVVIHQTLPGPVRNPDVVVNTITGEVHPKIPDAALAIRSETSLTFWSSK